MNFALAQLSNVQDQTSKPTDSLYYPLLEDLSHKFFIECHQVSTRIHNRHSLRLLSIRTIAIGLCRFIQS
jgi:hypothetical protein